MDVSGTQDLSGGEIHFENTIFHTPCNQDLNGKKNKEDKNNHFLYLTSRLGLNVFKFLLSFEQVGIFGMMC